MSWARAIDGALRSLARAWSSRSRRRTPHKVKPPSRRRLLFEMLEPRLLLSATPLHDPQIVYLAAGGAENVDYQGPVSVTGISIPAFQAPGALRGHEQEVLSVLRGALASEFDAGTVTFTTDQPATGDYSTVYLGGDGAAFERWGHFKALAE